MCGLIAHHYVRNHYIVAMMGLIYNLFSKIEQFMIKDIDKTAY